MGFGRRCGNDRNWKADWEFGRGLRNGRRSRMSYNENLDSGSFEAPEGTVSLGSVKEGDYVRIEGTSRRNYLQYVGIEGYLEKEPCIAGRSREIAVLKAQNKVVAQIGTAAINNVYVTVIPKDEE